MNIQPPAGQGWLLAFAPALLLALAVLAVVLRRARLRDYAQSHRQLIDARQRGSHNARLQHPKIDLTQCIGCGACVRACPEEGVLSLLHGQAVVVHGARCVGHGLCAAACPTAAISLTLGDVSKRRDLPALSSDLEAVNVPGLFLAGEVGGFALVRTAVAQGIAVADAVARRVAVQAPIRLPVPAGARGDSCLSDESVLDLLIVGAGPGGLACSLRAKERELQFLVIEQEPRIGGAVSAYPRRKMVMTQPVDLPMHGRLPKLTYQKEELVELWQQVAQKNRLPIRLGVSLQDLSRDEQGVFTAKTSAGVLRARNVCLAVGRRGSSRRLGVPGEELPKVAYSLLDAESYRGRRILVVGGGDSAIEAALGLCEEPGNQVTLSYRKSAFSRLKARNESRINKVIREGRIDARFDSELVWISPKSVRIVAKSGAETELPNDDVFIFAGGDPPFALLERAGVSFDPVHRPPPTDVLEPPTGLLSALSMTLVCAVGVILWAVWFHRYYALQPALRVNSSMHPALRPAGPVGLWAGLAACALFVWNLAYLIRRSRHIGWVLPGTLRRWMGWHVFSGLTAVLCVLLHSGFAMRPTVGGHAFLALALVVFSGSIGRYLYAFIPRAANGTEGSLDDLRTQLANLSAEWDRDGRGFGTRVRSEIDALVDEGRWRPGFFARIGTLIAGQFRLSRTLRQFKRAARGEGVSTREIRNVLMLARRAYRLTVLVTHYDQITAVVSSWRYFHRWLALLLVLLAVLHIVTAARYAQLDLRFTRGLFTGGVR